MVKKLSDFVIKNSLWIIIVSIVFTAGMSIFLKNLYIDNDIKNWVSPQNKIGKMPHYIDEKFGGTTPILVVIKHPDVFSYDCLKTIRKISRTAKQYDEIESVMSLTETVDMSADEYGILIRDLYGDTIPTNSARLLELKNYILSSPVYAGKIVSRDGKSTLIYLKIKPGKKGDQVTKKVKNMVMETIDPITMKAYVGGNPAIMNDLSDMVIHDLWFLIPGVVLILIGILFLSFRTLRGVLLPLITVLMATLIALGLMGLLGGTFSMLGAAMPVILIAVSSAYSLHYLNRYYEAGSLHGAETDMIIHKTSSDITIPILMAGLTTFFGFLSLVVSDITIIRSFGIFISIGILFAIALALLFVPALLHRLPLQKVNAYQQHQAQEHVNPGKFAGWVTRTMLRYKWVILSFFIMVSGACLFLLTRIRPELDFISYFKPGSQTQEISKIISQDFGGFSPFSLYVKGDIQDADVQKLMLILEEDTRSIAPMGTIGGINRVIAELNQLTTGVRTLPETTPEVNGLWFFIEGQKDTASLVTPDKKEALINFMLPSVASSFEKKLYIPLQKVLDRYNHEFPVMAVQPTNFQVVQLVSLMLSNRIIEVNPSKSEIIRQLPGLADTISREIMIQKAVFPGQKIKHYLQSEECEIAFKNKAMPALITTSLENSDVLSPLAVSNTLTKTLKGYDPGDVSSLAESISMLVQEEYRVQKLDKAVALAQARLGTVIAKSELEYALGPFLWSSIPVEKGSKGTLVRKVQVGDLRITGTSWLYYQVKTRLTRGQLLSILIAIIAVLFLNTYTFGDLRTGLLSMIPILYTLLVNFGIMGLLDIPLDIVTAIIASIAIGTGIDYTIHFITRFRIENKKHGGDMEKTITMTLTTVGKGILFNALSVGAGFLVLLFANVIPMRTLGLMLAVSMVVSSSSALIILPLLIHDKEYVKQKS